MLRKLNIGLLSALFVVAWVFFTPPGRRGLERMGVYTECAIDVWSLRKHCNTQPAVAAEKPASPQILGPAPPVAQVLERPPLIQPAATATVHKASAPPAAVITNSAQPRPVPKTTQTYWAARHARD